MKEAMWGLGLIVLTMFVFIIIAVLSNITLTNQQDYYGLKNSVEAAMYDAIDMAKYKKGICICTKSYRYGENAIQFSRGSQEKEYDILEPNENNECGSEDPAVSEYKPSECVYKHGEYVIDKDVFTESVISRLGSILKPSEIYEITVQDVIEYPPKVSVLISYKQGLSEMDGSTSLHDIPNQIDAIIEDFRAKATVNPTVIYDNDEFIFDANCDEPKEGAVTVYHYEKGTTTSVCTTDSSGTIKEGGTYTAKPCTPANTSYKFDSVVAPEGSSRNGNDVTITIGEGSYTVTYYYAKKSGGSSSGGRCNWHFNSGIAYCKTKTGSTTTVTYGSGSGKSSCKQAYNDCVSTAKRACEAKGYTFVSANNCKGIQNWNWDKDRSPKNVYCVSTRTKTCGSDGSPTPSSVDVGDCHYKCQG